jgi:tetratricopeptide (TPR) repeat protein
MAILIASLALTFIFCLSACTSIDHNAACNHYLAKASSASDAKDFAAAQEYLGKAGREAELNEDESQKRRVLREQASTFLCQHNPQAAEATARQLIKLYDGTSEKNMSRSSQNDIAEGRSRARIILSDALLAQKRPDKAAAVLEAARKEAANLLGVPELQGTIDDRYLAALQASGRAANSPGIAAEADLLSENESQSWLGEARKLEDRGQYEEEIVLLKKAQQAAIRSGCEEPYVRATDELAYTYYVLNHTTEAREQALKAVQKTRSADKISSIEKSSALAVFALTSANPRETAEALKKASAIDAGATFGQLLQVFKMDSKRPFAAKVRECDLMWSLAPGASPQDRVQALLQRSILFSDHKGKYVAAVAWFLEHAKSPLLIPNERMSCYQYAANLLLSNNRLAECQQILRQALRYREHLKKNDLPDTWDSARWLADDYYVLGRSQEAIAAAEHSLALLPANPETVASPGVLAHLTLTIAQNCRNEHEYQKALEYYDKTIAFERKGKLADELQKVLAERAEVAAQIKHGSQK